jgi:hypothetical protein
VRLFEPLRLGPLAGAGGPQKDQVHRTLFIPETVIAGPAASPFL